MPPGLIRIENRPSHLEKFSIQLTRQASGMPSVRKVVLFIIITLIKIIKRTMATVKKWIEERLLLMKQALQQPIVPNTP